MKGSVLLYNLYPKSIWKDVTSRILKDVPHDDIFIHVGLDWQDKLFRKNKIEMFLKGIPKVKKVFFSKNNPDLGEVVGLEKMRKEIDLKPYSILTYMHSKGVTKPDNQYVQDWVELMRYFQVEKFDLCQKVFDEGYALYGVKLAKYEGGERIKTYKYCDFWYGGTFVSCNMEIVREAFMKTPIPQFYYGVEAFWGNLTTLDKAYNAHQSPSLYDQGYPAENYKDPHHL